MKTKTIFRKYHTGEIIALFPEIPSDVHGHYCESYQQIGQHGAASCEQPSTSPATPEEYADLKSELERIGYEVTVCQRITRSMHDKRRAEAFA